MSQGYSLSCRGRYDVLKPSLMTWNIILWKSVSKLVLEFFISTLTFAKKFRHISNEEQTAEGIRRSFPVLSSILYMFHDTCWSGLMLTHLKTFLEAFAALMVSGLHPWISCLVNVFLRLKTKSSDNNTSNKLHYYTIQTIFSNEWIHTMWFIFLFALFHHRLVVFHYH